MSWAALDCRSQKRPTHHTHDWLTGASQSGAQAHLTQTNQTSPHRNQTLHLLTIDLHYSSGAYYQSLKMGRGRKTATVWSVVTTDMSLYG